MMVPATPALDAPARARPRYAGEGQPVHDVIFHDGVFPAADVARFVAEALRADAGALVVVRRSREPLLRAVLAELAPDADAAEGRGQLVWAHADELLPTLLEEGMPTARRFDATVLPSVLRLEERFGAARVYGEMVDVLCGESRHEAAAQLERLWNTLLERVPCRLLCAYDLAHFSSAADAELFGQICGEHVHVVTPGSSGVAETGAHAWQRLAAELAQRSRALREEGERRRALEGERAGLVAATRRTSSHLARLQRVTSALVGARSAADVGAVVVGAMAEALHASDALLASVDAAGHLEPIARSGPRAAAAAGPLRADRDGALARALDAGRLLWLGPAGEGALRCEEVVAIPLDVGDRRVGAVAFGFDRPQRTTPADRALVEDLRRQAALALDRALLLESAVRERARAEEASRARDEFLAMLGHELRNPLSPMVTVLQLARGRGDGLSGRELDVVERQLGHMVRLVDDLLDVARVVRGRLELRRRELDLREVVLGAVEAAAPLVEGREHALELRLPDAPLTVDGDPERLSQAVTNLLVNAAQYTPHRGRLRVDAEVRGDEVSLRVADDGRGIDPALLPRVFDLFVQGRRELDRAEGGLGLGLALVRSIVELHGGTVAAHSEGPGLGSAFTVTLPLLLQRDLALPAPPPLRAAEAARRILVVDDNVDAAEALGEALRSAGHEVEVAYDAAAALASARGFHPDLALLDIGLPGMSGWELGERLRAEVGALLRLVAVTGYGLDADRARSRSAGFDAHLVKPVDLTVIQDTVRRSLAAAVAPSA